MSSHESRLVIRRGPNVTPSHPPRVALSAVLKVGSYEKRVNLRKHEDESQPHIFGYGRRNHGGLTQFMGGLRLLKEGTAVKAVFIDRMSG